MMIFIFLNYFKKRNCLYKYIIKSKRKEYTRSRSINYKMVNDYIKLCGFSINPKREKLKEIKDEFLYEKKDKEKSEEKNNNNLNNNINSILINKILNTNSSKTNNQYFMIHCDTSNALTLRKSKISLKKPKINKDIIGIETNCLSNIRVSRKVSFSEQKTNIILDYNNKKKNINNELEKINKEHFLRIKKKKKQYRKISNKSFNCYKK